MWTTMQSWRNYNLDCDQCSFSSSMIEWECLWTASVVASSVFSHKCTCASPPQRLLLLLQWYFGCIVRIDPRFLPISLSFAISSLRVTSLIIAHRFVCHDHQSASVSTSVHSQFLPSAHFHVHVCSPALVCAYICPPVHLSTRLLS